jgi:hypothetical protein
MFILFQNLVENILFKKIKGQLPDLGGNVNQIWGEG